MIYLEDLILCVGYLVLKRIIRRFHDTKLFIFFEVRDYFRWIEFMYVLVWVYITPTHKPSEAAVTVFMCLMTKLAFNYLHLEFPNNKKQ